MTKTIPSILIACFLTTSALAQITGSISGNVRDQQGGALAGASIRIVNDENGQSVTVLTDSTGRFHALSMPAGTYSLATSKQGLQNAEVKGLELSVAQEVVVNFELSAAGSRAARMIAKTVQGGVIDSRTIRDIPLVTRSYDLLATLAPGTITYAPGAGFSFEFSMGRRFSSDGGRGYTNSFLLDGTSINDHANGTPGNASSRNPGIESVREFTVLTGTNKAEYGQASGAIVAAVTRSGTNRLHGSAYLFHLNSEFSARNFFDFGDVPDYHSNQFGGSLGGPIRKNRTFFFGNYEGWREELGLTFVSIVPNASVHLAILPGFGGIGTQVLVAPSIRPFLALFPLPNSQDFGGGFGLFFYQAPLTTNGSYSLGRVDHQISDTVNLFGRYSFDDDNRVSPQFNPLFENTMSARRQYATVQLVHRFGSNKLNSFRLAYNRSAQAFDSLPKSPLGPETSFVPGQPIGAISVPWIDHIGNKHYSATTLEI